MAADVRALIHELTKEVRETTDSKEAALLVQSGGWIVLNAAVDGDEVLWVLGRIC